MYVVYDKKPEGLRYKHPIWWEEAGNSDNFGTICVICGQHVPHEKNHSFAPGINMDRDMEGSAFCLCFLCVCTKGARPTDPTIDRHDKAVLQRFSAVFRTFKKEIRNARGRR